ncbi:MAG: alpha/beta hydrolase [Nitrospirota bacterium]
MRKSTGPFARIAWFLTIAVLWVCAPQGRGIPALPPGSKTIPNLVYKNTNGRQLLLDLYLPAEASGAVPVIIYLHGGGWEQGSRHQCPAFGLIPEGFAVASIDYRLSREAPFPAQIEDCKAAVRWLRANASKYNLDPDRFGVWGTSAGGHLAALLGTSGGAQELEGGGDNLQYSSRVQAACAVSAPTDLRKFGTNPAGAQIGPRAQQVLTNLFGGAENKGALAAMASPIKYVSKDDPPFLVVHGEYDRVVPVEQAHQFYEALQKAGVKATLKILPNQGHRAGLMGAVKDAEAFFGTTLKKH